MELELEQTKLSGYKTVLSTTVFQEETMEMIVPDAYPDILRIVDTEGQVELGERNAMDGRAGFSGTVRAAMLYLPDGEDGMRRLEISIPFSGGADGTGITGACSVVVLPRVEGAETRVLNPRKVLVRVGLAVDVHVYEPLEQELCSGVAGVGENGVEQLCETCRTYGVVCIQEKPFSFSDNVTLSASKPEAAELLKQRLILTCNESKVIGSKLIFKGTASLQLFYRSTDLILCDSLFELPFSQIMEVPGGREESDCVLDVVPVKVSCTLAPDGDSRTIHVELELLAQAVLRDERSFSLLTDLYSTTYMLDADLDTISLAHLVDSGVKTPALREIVECPSLAETVLDAYLSIGRVTQSREGTRLTLEAETRITVLYCTESGEVECASRVLSVPCTLELPGESICNCVCCSPEPVFATPTTGGIEVRFPVEFRYLALREETVSGVSAARLDPNVPRKHGDQPSIVLRMVEHGERLWDIAKCYGTTAADIRQANALEEERLPDGQLLLIPRKRS